MKYLWIMFCILLLVGSSWYFYQNAITQSDYEGLPTVPCIDDTMPIIQNFSLIISITIRNTLYPLSPTIGHDAGNCLHDIFVQDASGKVYIKANDKEMFTLGQFFDVWKKTFTSQQIFSFPINREHPIEIKVNGKHVDGYRNTILAPHQIIQIIYH